MRMRPDLPSESHDAQLGEFGVARPTPTVIHMRTQRLWNFDYHQPQCISLPQHVQPTACESSGRKEVQLVGRKY
jgi:hypothetical protein